MNVGECSDKATSRSVVQGYASIPTIKLLERLWWWPRAIGRWTSTPFKTVKIETNTWHFGRIKKKQDRPWFECIVRQRRVMKAFVTIKFKQKWMMPLCFPNHLVSAWYLTLDAQIHIWLSNWLVNVSHLNFPRRFFFVRFLLRLKCQVLVSTLTVLFDKAISYNCYFVTGVCWWTVSEFGTKCESHPKTKSEKKGPQSDMCILGFPLRSKR
jgi:hypothetical protein